MSPIIPLPMSPVGTRLDATLVGQRVKEPSDCAPSTATAQTQRNRKTGQSAEEMKLQQAAQDFEAVFLRQMLSCLERTTKVSSKDGNTAGQGAYGSMIVDAVSEAVAKAGGLGLADVLAKAMKEHLQAPSAHTENNPPTDLSVKSTQVPSGSRSGYNGPVVSEDERISPQGLAQVAVPRTEIRTSAVPITGPLVDRRIR